MKPQGTVEYNSLNWVKKQLDTVLKEAQTALSGYIEDSSDGALMQECIDGLRLVYGTLQMVEIYGAAMLTEEMERTARATLEGRIDQRDDAYDVLMRAMLQLPDYLESLQSGQKDNAIALMPLMNDLRAVRKDNLLSENVLFFPDIEAVEVDDADRPHADIEAGKLESEARRLRTHFQLGLLDVLKNGKLQPGSQRMLAVVHALEKVSADNSVRRFWIVIGALLEAVHDRGVDTNVSVKMLLGSVDRQIRLLTDVGEVAFADQFSQELLKNILYYVGRSTSAGARVSKVRAMYRLDDLLSSASGEAAGAGIGGLNAELFETVSQGIKEDLAQVKEALEIFVHAQEKDVASLAAVVEQLGRIGDTYGMLGLGSTRQAVLDQRDIIDNIAQGRTQADDDAIMAIAGELLSAESDLENYIARRSGAVLDEEEDEERIVPVAEYREVLSTVVAQGLENFTEAKEAILAYTSGIGNEEQLQRVLQLLEEVRGVSLMLPMVKVERLIHDLMDYVRIALIDNMHRPDAQEQDAVADVVTSIEYYLEAIVEGRPGVEEGLRTGEAAAEQLVAVYCQYEPAAAETRPAPQEVAEEPAEKPTAEIIEFSPETAHRHIEAAPAEAEEETSAEAAQLLQPVEAEAPVETVEAGAAIEVEEIEEQPVTVVSSIDSEQQYAILGDDADEEILEIFIEEALEVLGELNANLPAWKSNPADGDALAVVRRGFHTLKGSGRLIGAELIGEFSWKFENMLNRVIEGKIEADDNVMNSLEESVTVLPQLIEQLQGNREPIPNVYQLMAAADAISEGREIAAAAAPAVPVETAAPEVETIEAEAAEQEAVEQGLYEPHVVIADESMELERAAASEAAEVTKDLEGIGLEMAGEAAEQEQEWTGPEPAAGELAGEAFIIEEPESSEGQEAWSPPVAEEAAETGAFAVPETEQVETSDRAGALEEEAISIEEPEALELHPEMYDLDAVQEGLEDEFGELSPELIETQEFDEEAGVEAEVVPPLEEAAEEVARETAESLEPGVEDFEIELEDVQPAVQSLEESVLGIDMDPVLFGIYYDETHSHLELVNSILREHEETGRPVEASKDLFRAFHTLFGSARTAEIDEIANICGIAEKYLKTRQEGSSIEIPESVVELFGEITVAVSGMLEEIRQGRMPRCDRALQDRMNAAVKAELQQQLQSTSQAAPAFPQEETEPSEDVWAEAEAVEDTFAAPQLEPEPEAAAETEAAGQEQFVGAPAAAADENEVTFISYADIDSDLIDIFLEEADELVESCEGILQTLSGEPGNAEAIKQLQRHMHTLKGGARMAELTPVGDLTHMLESLVIKVAEKSIATNKQLFDTLNESVDRLASMLKDVKNRAPVTRANDLIGTIEALLKGERIEQRAVERFDLEIDDLAGGETAAEQAKTAEEAEDAETKVPLRRASDHADEPHWGERATDVNFRESQEQIRVRADLLNNLVNSAGEVNIYHARMGKQMSDIAFNLGELDATVVRLKQQLRNLDIETEIQIRSTYEKESDQYDEDFDPLEMDRYSTMQQLSRSLAETANDVESIRTILGDIVRDSETLLLQESRVSTELQEGLMRTRMVRFGGLGTRLRRIVRQTARELHKDVELEMVGENNELDRTVLDRIIAPLEHMLRNAVAHGIETPDKRAAAGKPDSGTIRITVDRQGADVVIKVRDDGRGIDAAAVRSKALRQGLLDKNNKLSDHDVLQFILKSGFSTADEVTQVSGRGVGMDVVDTELKQLGGTLEINTWEGKGTEFTIRLPLTLAINQALLVSAAEDIFAIPLASIEGVVRVTGAELQQFYNSDQRLYEFNNVQYELKHLGRLLTGSQPDYSELYNLFPVLLAQVGDQHYALHVDELVGRREIVVKPVGHQISAVRGIAGATILADGRVVLILEMSALVVGESLFIEPEEKPVTVEEVVVQAAEEHKTIMVVDDSITIRKVTARMLERNGINVLLAKDGVDATNQLVEHVPDLMLLDIEMPRMDGFELASYIRNDERLKDIPIIMITSRTGSKHKEKAMEIGVNQYLGKPYQEEELMKNIKQFI